MFVYSPHSTAKGDLIYSPKLIRTKEELCKAKQEITALKIELQKERYSYHIHACSSQCKIFQLYIYMYLV